MDEKVLKIITVLMCVLAIVVGVSLYFLPDLHEMAVLAEQKREEIEYIPQRVVKAAKPAQEVVEEEPDMLAQLKIELPAGLTMDDLQIENQYLTQTIFVRFPNGVADYFSNYSIRGSSDHIESLSYYVENEFGVIMLKLDKVYELQTTFSDESLYVDFLNTHDVYDKVVVIDAGHGSKAVGAVRKDYYEKEINLQIAMQLKTLLDEDPDHIGVYYTREDDSNPSFEQRVGLANKADADVFISIHNNTAQRASMTNLRGTQVLYSESDDSEHSSEHLAQLCLDSVVAEFESKSIGLLPGDDIYIIRNSKVPVALVEVGFMTNSSDLEKLVSEEYQKKAANGIYHAIKQALQEGY